MEKQNLKRKLIDRFFWIKWLLVFGGFIGGATGLYLTHEKHWDSFSTGLVSGAIYLTTAYTSQWLLFRNLD